MKRIALLAAVFSIALFACRWPRAELLVRVESDLEWGPGKRLSSVVITVRSGSATGALALPPRRIDLDPNDPSRTLPLSFEVHPLGDDPDRVAWIEVLGCGDDGCASQPPIAAARLTTRFTLRTLRTVTLALDSRCEGIVCRDATQTCSAGDQLCVPSDDGEGGRTPRSDGGSDANDAAMPAHVFAGGGMTCTVRSDQSTRCSGGVSGRAEALAFGDTARTRSEWTDLLGVDHAAQIAIGAGTACVLRDDGSVSCRGENGWGEYGDGTIGARPAASTVIGLPGSVRQIAAGLHHACARIADGSVWCWGRLLDPDASPDLEARVQRELPVAIDGVHDAVDIAAGDEFDCARTRDLGVLCWGVNAQGQLGDGTVRDHAEARPVIGIANAVGLALGARHACARLREGTVRCWGDGSNGQRGGGARNDSLVATAVDGLADVTRLTAGAGHTCARDSAGRVSCWGRNDHGQLGDGTTTDRFEPISVETPGPALDLVAGREHTCVRTIEAGVTCWGSDTAGQLATGRDLASVASVAFGDRTATSIAAAEGLSCSVGTDGVRCAGLTHIATTPRRAGALHEGARTLQSAPTAIEGLPSDTTTIATGLFFACALQAGGGVLCWGDNAFGQLGDGTTVRRATPASVPGISDAVQVCAGQQYTCARMRNGSVSCWGANDKRQMGTAETTEECNGLACTTHPVTIRALPPATQIACGETHACALDADGHVHCWGNNDLLATGSPVRTPQAVPVLVPAIPPVHALAAGNQFTCALAENGSAWCWGDDGSGQTGDMTGTFCGVRECTGPRAIALRADSPAVEIAAGVRHACVRTMDGRVYCWGQDEVQQLGASTADTCDETIACVSQPRPFAFPRNEHATSLGLSYFTTCVTTDLGNTYCSGTAQGAVIPMNNGLVDASQPTLVPALHGATEMSGRMFTMCGRIGGIWNCWGDNYGGQLGNGHRGYAGGAQLVALDDVEEAGVGRQHSCARRRDGSVWCFGANPLGQIGREPADLVMTATPVRVVDSGARHLTTNGNFNCVIMEPDGHVECWGGDYLSQLGMALPANYSATPLPVPGTIATRQVALGVNYACAVGDDELVRCWGNNYWGQCGQSPIQMIVPPTVVPGLTGVAGIAVTGDQSVCAWKHDGTTYCWGLDHYGGLASGGLPGNSPHPDPQPTVLDPDVDNIRGGQQTFCAHHRNPLPSGHYSCWGSNRAGEFGLGFVGATVGPETVRIPDVDEVSPGGEHGFTCARNTLDHTGMCWGANWLGALGDGTPVDRLEPHPILGLADIANLFIGPVHSCAVTGDHRLSCWGEGFLGQTGTAEGLSATSPAPILGLETARDLSAGLGFVCARLASGTVWCAGNNESGQLGDGTRDDHTIAIAVHGISTATAITSGIDHSCALLGDQARSVVCWGRGDSGQLGVDARIVTRSQALGVGIDSAIDVSAGGRHTCAVRSDHTVWCWGADDRGQLGVRPDAPGVTVCPRLGLDGLPSRESFPCSFAPVRVPGITNARSVVAGGLHTCALLLDGTVTCWGADVRGVRPYSITPVAVEGLAQVASITASRRASCRIDESFAFDCEPAGRDVTCALREDHTAWCWGHNDRGQLGDGTRDDHPMPVRATAAGESVTMIRAGGAQTCASHDDGSVTCFGDDSEGQLGDGASAQLAASR